MSPMETICGWANIIGCAALTVLALYFVALVAGLARHALTRPLTREAEKLAKRLTNDLRQKSVEGQRLLSEIATGSVDHRSLSAARRWGVRARTEELDAALLRASNTVSPLSIALKEALRDGQRDLSGLQDIAEHAVAAWRRGWNQRFGVLMFAAPPAGAAPTMSGAAAALAAFAQSKGNPLSLLDSMPIALGTTYVGALISVGAALAALAASQVMQRESHGLADVAARLLHARDSVLSTRAKIINRQSQLPLTKGLDNVR